MSNENRRLILFVLLTFGSIWGIQYLIDVMGLNPPPPKRGPEVAKIAKGAGPAKNVEKQPGKDTEPAKTPEAVVAKDQETAQLPAQRVALADPNELVIGSAVDH